MGTAINMQYASFTVKTEMGLTKSVFTYWVTLLHLKSMIIVLSV